MKRKLLHNNELKECSVIVQYLISVEPTAEFCELYRVALKKKSFKSADAENHLWITCLNHSWMLKYIDAYLAWRNPSHFVRQRILFGLTLLETRPEYSAYFLPAPFSIVRLPLVLLQLIKSYLKIIAGRILISRYE